VSTRPAGLSGYPTPPRGALTAVLTLDTRGDVVVALYDLLGRRLAVLHDGPLAGGEQRLELDASHLAAGTYLIRATGADLSQTALVTLAR
jgi:hypothetical protein